MPTQRAICECCGGSIPPHAHYLVKIDIYADPNTPAVDTGSDEAESSGESIEALLKQMKSMSADDLQDAVHRRFSYIVCGTCQKVLIANPLGLPRPGGRRRLGDN